ncbi:GerMN domain-containing protein [Streptomyces olivochromogenes]|nr:GerMN domain-containing protein [Streptomyces olivochromogenes]
MAAVAGCGVQPTGVVDAGEPAAGLTKGMRIYFASDTGLRGVSRPDREVTELGSAVKLLVAGPNASEQKSGLTNLVEPTGTYTATGHGKQVTLDMPGTLLSPDNRLLNGQLVCSLARAQSLLEPDIRPDDVQVTLKPDGRPLGPYRCSYFLDN